MVFSTWQAAIKYYEAEGFRVARYFCPHCGVVLIIAFDPKDVHHLGCVGCGERINAVRTVTSEDYDA